MQLEYSPGFKKQWAKVPKKIRVRAMERLALLCEDPFNLLLNNHKLAGRYASHRSINITGDWRIVYRQIHNDTLHLRVIGTHSQLYS
jgi:addiction module RelE/StbE family toxin